MRSGLKQSTALAGVDDESGLDPDLAAAPRLSRALLARLPRHVVRPRFDPALLRPGIVHLGCGSFHRAHQALLTQEAIEEEGRAGRHGTHAPPPWGILAASLVNPAVVRALHRQDGLYTVLEHTDARLRPVVVGSLCGLMFGPEAPERLRAALADPAVKLVTLTITAGGYCTDPVSGGLDPQHPQVRADLCSPSPASAVGVVVQALADRRNSGLPPPVVLSCDNLPANGRLLRRACIDHARLRDDRLANWIEGQVQFPATMVDRIVPAATEEDRREARATIGMVDEAALAAEGFRQWVIEDFDGERPMWEAVGAQYVADVSPWEASKLRLLNGGHLALACLGLLAGCATVAETVALPGFAAFALRFMLQEQKPTLPPSDHDITAYAHQLIARWRCPQIAHSLERVSRDASAKLPTRLLASLRDNLAAGRAAPCTVLAIAAWMRCAAGLDDHGRPLALTDPMAVDLGRIARQRAGHAPSLVAALLQITEIFGVDLPLMPGLQRQLVGAVSLLQHHGAVKAVDCMVRHGWYRDHDD
jgi:fructuronate reductase